MSDTTNTADHGNNMASFIWRIADQLRGIYKPYQYGHVVLPLTILRRLDAILEPTKQRVLELDGTSSSANELGLLVEHELDLPFYNVSKFTFRTLLDDRNNLAANLADYIARFSPNVADIFERFKFADEIATLDEKDRLYIVIKQFAGVDLHPDTISNADMGLLFEELIRRFAESSNEEAGEHFTPRDAIRLLVDLLFAADDDALAEPGIVRRFYDPTAGTGGMLSVAEEHLLAQNPDAEITMFGQELNDFSYAICKADMIAKGQDADNIALGDTLVEDHFADRTFDYCMSNPPYGVDWKVAKPDVEAEARRLGEDSRFGHGLPAVSDGQMLFLAHLIYKLRPTDTGGGRAGIVMDGSPLFNGAAGSGPSEMRRWLFESDYVDAIVALPGQMFYNTGIGTYIWVLDNNKPVERRGTVQLIDARKLWEPMRKSLGAKRRFISDIQRDQVLKLYDDHEDADPTMSKVMATTEFGYQTITVERPLQLSFTITDDAVDSVFAAKTVAKLDHADQAALHTALRSLDDHYDSHDRFVTDLKRAADDAGLNIRQPTINAVVKAIGAHDENAEIVTDAKGNPKADTALRDSEDVPLGEDIEHYFAAEVLPHVPDAWIDHSKTKIGYEIPFNRIFYVYQPPRPLEDIDNDLNRIVGEIMDLLKAVES